jgi:hypothetical protein
VGDLVQPNPRARSRSGRLASVNVVRRVEGNTAVAVAEWQMEEAIGTLCGYSFLAQRDDSREEGKEEEEQQWFDIHRIVHLATRIWIGKHSDAAKVLDEAV